MLSLQSDSAGGTEDIGRRLAGYLRPGMCVYLQGELGAGKTTLVRGILRGLGHNGPVRSPTYTLVEPYDPKAMPVCHFDLYRLADAAELETLGMRDYLDDRNLCLVEWPERAATGLRAADLTLHLAGGDDRRTITLAAGSPSGAGALGEFGRSLAAAPNRG